MTSFEKISKFSVNDSLAMIVKECNVIFKKNDKEEEVNKVYVSVRHILELSLKIILQLNNPKGNPIRESLSNLIIHMRIIPEFNKEFNTFLYKAKDLGNKDAHGIIDNTQYEIIRLELYSYLTWFYNSCLKQNVPDILVKWKTNLSTDNEINESTESNNKDNLLSEDDSKNLKKFDKFIVQLKDVEGIIELFNLTEVQKVELWKKILLEFGVPVEITPVDRELSSEEFDKEIIKNLAATETYGLEPDKYDKLNIFIENYINEMYTSDQKIEQLEAASVARLGEMKEQIIREINE